MSHLPDTLQTMAELIGEEKALALGAAFGGVPIYIPLKPTKTHKYLAHISQADLAIITASWLRGTWFTLASGPARQKKPQVLAHIRRGTSIRNTALAVGVSTTYVERLRQEEKIKAQQASLF